MTTLKVQDEESTYFLTPYIHTYSKSLQLTFAGTLISLLKSSKAYPKRYLVVNLI